jgi:hypothetical protein
MVLSVGFDPTLGVLALTGERRPPEREPDSRRITAITETELPSAESGQRLSSPEATPQPTRVAFTAKFGPDEDGFPLQLIRGDQVTGAESIDVQVILDNRVLRDSQTALLQAQESRQENNLATGATAQTPVTVKTPEPPVTGATLETPETGVSPDTTPDTPVTAAPPDTPVTAPPPVTAEPDESRTESGAIFDLEV